MRRKNIKALVRRSAVVVIGMFGALLMADEPVSETGSDAEALFAKAVDHAAKGDIKGALDTMERVRKVRPGDPDVLWNLGIWMAEVADHKGASDIWKQYCAVEPNDWLGRAKLIQAYQSLNKEALVGRERDVLFQLRKKGDDPDLVKTSMYCREQFVEAGKKVMAFEYFEPSGDRCVYYRFAVLDAKEEEEYCYSLGSYKETVEMAWKLKEVSHDVRLCHLDRYDGDSHTAISFYTKGMPDYKTVRDDVKRTIAQEKKKK